jgi:carboxymethylenebutenolidase
MALREYLATEVAEDQADRIISRREALRRLGLLGVSASAAVALLAACAPSVRAPATGSQAAGTPASPPTRAPSSGPASGEEIRFPGPRGELLGFFADASQARGAMLVIHENRGLTEHIRSVAARLAADGYASLAPDLLSEEGGTAALGDPANVPAALANASTERLVNDMKAGLDELERRVPDARLGAIGFCFGGGMVWQLLAGGEPRLAAAVPFYGPAPEQPDFGGSRAAVLGVYAELDDRVNASREPARRALEAAGLVHEIRTYPGVDHAFFNDSGPRYDAGQAGAAYRDVLEWLARHLKP